MTPYRKWDDDWSHNSGPAIEVHFTQKPKPTAMLTGFWCEIALDGIVLFEREFAVSTHLIRIRHEIASDRDVVMDIGFDGSGSIEVFHGMSFQ